MKICEICGNFGIKASHLYLSLRSQFSIMRDVIWTIIAVWVIYRIYQAFKNSRVYVYQKHEHQHNYNSPRENEIKIDREPQHHNKKPNSDKGGEYVDFEEIK